MFARNQQLRRTSRYDGREGEHPDAYECKPKAQRSRLRDSKDGMLTNTCEVSSSLSTLLGVAHLENRPL